MDYALILILGLVAATLGGIVGFGASILLMPALVLVFGPREAVPIMAVASILANASRVAAWWGEIDWRAVGAYSATALPAAALGAATLLVLPTVHWSPVPSSPNASCAGSTRTGSAC